MNKLIQRLRESDLLLWMFPLLVLYFAAAPIVPRVITNMAGGLVALAFVFGLRGFGHWSRWSWIVYIGFLAYFVGGLLSLFNNHNWGFAGWRLEKYHPFILIGFVLSAFALKQELLRKWFPWCVFVGSLSIFGFSVYQHEVLNIGRVGIGTGINQNIFGHIAFAYSIVLFVFGITNTGRPFWRGAWMIGGLAAGYGGFVSGSRGALLGFLGSLLMLSIVLVWLARRSRRQRWGRVSISIFSILLLISVATTQSGFFRTKFRAMIFEIEQYMDGIYESSSMNDRISMLHGAILIWMEHPIIGTGLGDGQDDVNKLIADGKVHMGRPRGCYAIFHNAFADTFATTGTLGFILMLLGVYAIPCVYFYKSVMISRQSLEHSFEIAGFALLGLNFVFGMTNSWLYLRGLPLILALLCALVAGSKGFIKPGPKDSGPVNIR